MSEPQVLVAWAAAGEKPEIIGDAGAILPGAPPERLLAFGSWLEPSVAQAMEQRRRHAACARPRLPDEPAQPSAATPIEAKGRAIGGRAVLRLREVSGSKADLAELTMRYQNVLGDRGDFCATWSMRCRRRSGCATQTGLLTFVNTAYVRAVEAKDASEAVENGIEMFDRAARARARQGARSRAAAFPAGCRRSPRGQRRIFDVVDLPSGRGSAGIAIDATEVATMRSELGRMSDAHRRILDQLATGVAVFDADQKLAFYNAAYRALWELDAGFLDQSPTDSARARPPARHEQAARAAELPAVESAAARGLSRRRAERADVAPAGRPHAARRHRAAIRKAASPICSTTSPSACSCTAATTR